MDEWKSAVRDEFLKHAGDGVEFTDCDLFAKKTRFEVRYSKNGAASAVCLRRRDKGVYDPRNLTEEAQILGDQAALRE